MYIYRDIYVYVYIYTRMRVHVYIYILIYLHIYICRYIHVYLFYFGLIRINNVNTLHLCQRKVQWVDPDRNQPNEHVSWHSPLHHLLLQLCIYLPFSPTCSQVFLSQGTNAQHRTASHSIAQHRTASHNVKCHNGRFVCAWKTLVGDHPNINLSCPQD